MNHTKPHEQSREVLKKLTQAQRRALWNALFPGLTHECVRDFMVVDTANSENFGAPCIVAHMPSGCFLGFRLPFDVALGMLKEGPERDEQLIRLILGT